MATKLILIRHGETEWNAQRRYCGCRDIGLNARGKKQAVKLRQRIRKEEIHKIYSSDRKRAIETARIVFNHTAKIEKIADLKEIHFGCFEGLTCSEIMKKYKAIYQQWMKDPFKTIIPGSQPLGDFRKRVVSAFKKIIALNPNRAVAAVCHGGSISAFITYILKTNAFWKHIPHSASISIVEYKNGRPEIQLLNDTKHLDG